MTAIESCQSSSVTSCVCGPDPTDAGVVDHDVEPSEIARDRGEGGVDLLAHRHVRRIGASLDSGLRELVRRDSCRIGVDLDHRNRCSGLGELLRDAATETRSGPRHDRDLPAQHTHRRAPPAPFRQGHGRVYPARVRPPGRERTPLRSSTSLRLPGRRSARARRRPASCSRSPGTGCVRGSSRATNAPPSSASDSPIDSALTPSTRK